MRARAGMLTGASIDQAHAVEQMRCGCLDVHGVSMLCAPVATCGHSTADASGHAASGEQFKEYWGRM